MSIIQKFLRLGVLKTLWVNFYVLPLRQAFRLPIILDRKVRIGACKRGCIKIPDGGKFHVGFSGLAASCYKESLLYIKGELILKGTGYHTFAPGLIMRIAEGGTLEIGNNFSCHRDNTFIVNKSVVVGDNNMWSFEILVMDTDAHIIRDSTGSMINPNKEVYLGNNVWVGSRNTILKGSVVPDGCVLGSGGIVTKELTVPSSVYCGNELIREGVIWERTLNRETTGVV